MFDPDKNNNPEDYSQLSPLQIACTDAYLAERGFTSTRTYFREQIVERGIDIEKCYYEAIGSKEIKAPLFKKLITGEDVPREGAAGYRKIFQTDLFLGKNPNATIDEILDMDRELFSQ